MRSLRSFAFAALLLASVSAGTAHAQTVDWIRQLGTSANDYSYDVSVDGMGNVFISGRTEGDLGGINAGRRDAFVSKYDINGNFDWTRQLGTAANDESYGVSADGMGNVFISGWTSGDLGGTNAGDYDAFVSKYDASGNLDWTRQLGTSAGDYSYDVSADGMGNVFISGYTLGDLGGINAGDGDAFVSKYDMNGNIEWTKQLGTSTSGGQTGSTGISIDGLGNVFISGPPGVI